MRRMKTRQAITRRAFSAIGLLFCTACAPSASTAPASINIAPTATQTPPPTFVVPTETTSIATLACHLQSGVVETGSLDSTTPPQDFLIYLPPCYSKQTDQRYPVLYLLHGQTYNADQWIRLGATDSMNKFLLNQTITPFIVVFPDDRYWYTSAGAGFGERLADHLIPFIDRTYRTISTPRFRAIGGLSRGAGWALQLGFTRPDLFGVVGLHSLAIFQRDASRVEFWLRVLSPDAIPAVFMDIGRNDPELASARQIEALLMKFEIPHEWRLYSGAHTEAYWSAHMEEYIRWYAEQWSGQ